MYIVNYKKIASLKVETLISTTFRILIIFTLFPFYLQLYLYLNSTVTKPITLLLPYFLTTILLIVHILILRSVHSHTTPNFTFAMPSKFPKAGPNFIVHLKPDDNTRRMEGYLEITDDMVCRFLLNYCAHCANHYIILSSSLTV